MNEGFATTIEFTETTSGGNAIMGTSLKVKNLTPPGIDGGGENDTTTMHNTAYRTKQPKELKTLTNMTFIAAYDPAVYDHIITICNVNQEITITFPDTSTLSFWGWLNTFEPNNIEEGAQPEATCSIVCSNQDNSDVEQAPEFTAAA